MEQIRRILTNKPVSTETVPTVGLNGNNGISWSFLIFGLVSKCDLKGIQCQFWDLGGGGDLPKLWPKYYKESHAVFFVIDSSEFHRDKTKVTSTFGKREPF